MEPVEIAAGQLQLRPWSDADSAVELLEAIDEEEIRRWLPGGPEDLDAARAWLQRRVQGWAEGLRLSWAVRDSTTGALLGGITLEDVDEENGTASVGYWIAVAGRGRGVATQALRVVARWAFDAVPLHRLELDHAADNIGSCRVAYAAGFALEGVLRQRERLLDGRHDVHLHARLRTDDVETA